MSPFRHSLIGFAALLAACGTAVAPVVPEASGPAPDGCGRDFPKDAPLLALEPTRAPTGSAPRKGEPLKFANTLAVNRDITAAGEWSDFEDGWSSLALRLRSEGARTLSLHLAAAVLPPRTQVWFCSADHRVRQGPYREAVGGDLWTPVVPGAEAHLEVILPTRDKPAFRATLAEAYGGFR